VVRQAIERQDEIPHRRDGLIDELETIGAENYKPNNTKL